MFYWLLLASIEDTIWSIYKNWRGEIPFHAYSRGSSVKKELIIQILLKIRQSTIRRSILSNFVKYFLVMFLYLLLNYHIFRSLLWWKVIYQIKIIHLFCITFTTLFSALNQYYFLISTYFISIVVNNVKSFANCTRK